MPDSTNRVTLSFSGRGETCNLAAGQVVWLRSDATASARVADEAMGWPSEGDVFFHGRAWRDFGADEQRAARFRFRRIFDGIAWVSNLDILENILLSERHHGHRRAEALLQEAKACAATLDLALPAGRPAGLSPHQRYELQWVRALMGITDLVIVQWRPDRCRESLAVRAVECFLARSPAPAILWLGSSIPDEIRHGMSSPICFTLRNDAFVKEPSV